MVTVNGKFFKLLDYVDDKMEPKKPTKPKKFLCPICGKDNESSNRFREHLKSHDDNYRDDFLTCKLCGKTLKYQDSVKNHMKKIHGQQWTRTPTKRNSDIVNNSPAKKIKQDSLIQKSDFEEEPVIQKKGQLGDIIHLLMADDMQQGIERKSNSRYNELTIDNDNYYIIKKIEIISYKKK